MTQSSNAVSVRGLLRQAFDVCAEQTAALRKEFLRLPEAGYFLDVTDVYFDPAQMEQLHPKIIVFGTDFPMEIVHALTGAPPYWVIGGNRAFTASSDEDVPRDTDPVTRSALGQLLEMDQVKSDALVILPCSSDAQRKVAWFLQRRGWKVVTIWIPAVKDNQAHKAFVSELEHAIGTICRHVDKRYSARALERSTRSMNSIRASIHAFLDAARENQELMPGMLRMAILDSFFMATDLDDWHSHLKALTAALLNAPRKNGADRPRVLLIGSPVYFPNFKIPVLLESAGVEIVGSIDSRTGQYENAMDGESQRGLESLAHFYFEHDSSSAFVNNDQLVSAIAHYVEETKPDGILWHVLKGQIEYDFELNRCEAFFEEHDLPVIRLETDYQYQDVEQLRIRIEAFSELLTQKRKERNA